MSRNLPVPSGRRFLVLFGGYLIIVGATNLGSLWFAGIGLLPRFGIVLASNYMLIGAWWWAVILCWQNTRREETNLGALTASGGLCAPVAPNYLVPSVVRFSSLNQRNAYLVRNALPFVSAPRGLPKFGIRRRRGDRVRRAVRNLTSRFSSRPSWQQRAWAYYDRGAMSPAAAFRRASAYPNVVGVYATVTTQLDAMTKAVNEATEKIGRALDAALREDET